MTTPPTKPPIPPAPPAGEPALHPLLAFNGLDATTGEYLLPAMGVSELARVATGGRLESDEIGDLRHKSRQARKANYAVVEGVDPNDLAQAGWAVVFPAVADDPDAAERQAAIREALAPLLARRRAQATAGGADLYREYTGQLGYQDGESKQQYLRRLGAGPGAAKPTKVPYYLLLVATPDEIPYRIQYQLDVHYAVGRIAFDTVEEYARYAQGVVDAETGRIERPRRAAFFGVANPGDAATQLSADHLVLPLAEHVGGRYADRGWAVARHLGEDATRGRLVELLRDAPALLFTASHGVGLPSGNHSQRELQGALVCQDWAGPGKPVARDHYFAGADLPADADLRGMIAMIFACYGGGTPTRDEFTQRALGEVKAAQLAPSPLVARLPQRMLANPAGGALAVVAHVDRAWGSTFLWMDPKGKGQTMKHLDVFESAVDSLLAGKRLGYAMEAFNLRYAELAADLSERIEQIQLYDEHYEDSELAHMWLYNSDARNYAVLGDPAVCLASAGASARAEASRAARPAEVGAGAVASREPAAAAAAAAAGGAGAGAGAGVAEAEAGEAIGSEAAQASYGWFGGKGKGGTGEPDKDGGDGQGGEPDAGAAGTELAEGRRPGFLTRLGNKVGEMLGGVIGDVAVLEVKTYTAGDLPGMSDGAALHGSGARLRAYTRCELDGDTEACVPVTADGAVDQALWALHVEMVKQAQAHREELLKIVLSLFSANVKE
jgi:hypothetical protein